MKKYRYWLLTAAFVAVLLLVLFSSDVLSGEKEWVRSTSEPIQELYNVDYVPNDIKTITIYPLQKGEKIAVYGYSTRVETKEDTFESAPKLLGANGWCFVIGIKGPTEKSIVFVSEETITAREINTFILDTFKDNIDRIVESYRSSDDCYMGVEYFIYE